MRIRAVLLAILALAVAGCSGWASEQPLIPPGERDLVGLSGTYQSASHGVQVTPDGNAIYIMQEADPDSDQGENAEGPFEVAFDLLRSRSPKDGPDKHEPERTYLMQARWEDDLGSVSYFYTIMRVSGGANEPATSFTTFDMLCAEGTKAFASREEDGFCIFDDYRKLRAAAFDALAWQDDARMVIGETQFNRVEQPAPPQGR